MATNYRTFEYKVYNDNGKLEEYSGGFRTHEQALTWYNKHGKWLEKHFNRTLILISNKQISLFNREDYVSSTLFNK